MPCTVVSYIVMLCQALTPIRENYHQANAHLRYDSIPEIQSLAAPVLRVHRRSAKELKP